MSAMPGMVSVQANNHRQTGPRTCVFFHYFEADSSYRDNLVFFLSCAWTPYLDFFLVIAGNCSVELPAWPNLRIIRTENRNLDYGGYCDALEDDFLVQRYEFFIFVNCSTRGPFASGKIGESWHKKFTGRLRDGTHLVGSSVNALSMDSPLAFPFRTAYPAASGCVHIQTTAYALTQEAIRHLKAIGFYQVRPPMPKHEVIAQYEIRLTQEVLARGWGAECLLSRYRDFELSRNGSDPNESSCNGDPLFRGAYFGGTVTAEEVVFLKTNRDLLDECRLAFLTLRYLLGIRSSVVRSWKPYRRLRVGQFLAIFSNLGKFRVKIPYLGRFRILRNMVDSLRG